MLLLQTERHHPAAGVNYFRRYITTELRIMHDCNSTNLCLLTENIHMIREAYNHADGVDYAGDYVSRVDIEA